jgi:ribonuclease VapC
VIVVDTSALVAILLDEADAVLFEAILALESDVRLSAMTDYETRILAFSRGAQPLVSKYETLCDDGGFSIEAFGRQESMLAFDAYRRFGEGNHPARLNFGDCAAYALAKSLEAPLLFKGNDFARTDIRRAL